MKFTQLTLAALAGANASQSAMHSVISAYNSPDAVTSLIVGAILRELGLEDSSFKHHLLVGCHRNMLYTHDSPFCEDEEVGWITTIFTWDLYILVTPFVFVFESIRQTIIAILDYMIYPALEWVWT